ncbi:hypothetical protein AA13595_1916 [Gluconacetobacter johannae DSM 13595]|uniref:UrcA family protein n=1 Tax=Gluconacetobacter johannae TaxID=112140 RepID=A0A7W4J8V9_9PROT|nr:UrcA family protein [Gluconacetobacter johannae]MBB2176829.1 UrcA family protein [Gluconacetobacter johannae]GBQ86537.1 hypothetical protein AA13595_1916 [Gluconacetobacter johannae DSM 13595]
MTTVFRTLALAAVLGVAPMLAVPGAVHAQSTDQITNESEQVTVEATHHVRVVYFARDLQDVPHARQFIARLDRAALVACGDDTALAAEIRRAIERSDCRRDGVLRAISDIRNPMLDQALSRYGLPA